MPTIKNANVRGILVLAGVAVVTAPSVSRRP